MAREEFRLRKRRAVQAVAGLFVLGLQAGMTLAQVHQLEAWTVAGGGGTTGGGDTILQVTAGQPAAGAAAGGSYTLSAGFWSLDAEPQPTPVTTPTPRATSTATPTLLATETPTMTFPAASTPTPTTPLSPVVPALGRNGLASLACVAGLFGAALLLGLPSARRNRGARRRSIAIGATILSAFLCQGRQAIAQTPVGSGFTFQGRLSSGDSPVNGDRAMTFRLYPGAAEPVPLGTLSLPAVAVTEGSFSVILDFGAEAFDGSARWIGVSIASEPELAPRQELTATPYSVHAMHATEADLLGGSTASEFASSDHAHDDYVLRSGGTVDGTLSVGERIGIGTTSPTRLLHVKSDLAGEHSMLVQSATDTVNPVLELQDSSPGQARVAAINFLNNVATVGQIGYTMSTHGMNFNTNGFTRMIIDGTGNVGIGVQPAVSLDVVGTIRARESGSGGFGVLGHTFSTNGVGVYGVSDAQSGSGAGVRGTSLSSDGYAGHFVSEAADGTALFAQGSGSDRNKATLRVRNTEANGGIAAHVTNESNFTTAHLGNAGTGEVLFLVNGGTNAAGANGGDFLKAVNAPESDTQFRIDTSGTVYADGSFNCGLSSGCFNTGSGADLAERIDVTEALEPGDVVSIDPARPEHFHRSRMPASALVAGVVSTQPAMTMANNDLASNDTGLRTDRRPMLALVGRVPVKASAENGAIDIGDLLVSASTPGHAMRAGQDVRPGTVLGKALSPLASGTGTVQMLVTLQ